MNIGQLIASIGIDTIQLKGAEQAVNNFANNASSSFSKAQSSADSFSSQIVKLTAVVGTLYAAYSKLNDAISYGMRVETLGVAMNVVAKNTGLSADTVNYFAQEVKKAGITSTEAFSTITKAMIQGLDLNKMKELATRARDIAVVAGLNTSEAFERIMHGVESGNTMVFRTLGINIGDSKQMFDAYAKTINKTGEQLTIVERRQATLNAVLVAAAGYAGAAAAADETAGKMLASLDRIIKDTYESFWQLFSPGTTTAIQKMTDAFEELQKWAEANSLELRLWGQDIGSFISTVGTAIIETGKWAAAHRDLVEGLLELYIIVKVAGWIKGFAIALNTAKIAAGGLAGVITGTLLPALLLLEGAAGILGAIKSFQGKGDLGQGIGQPGTATMGDDMWEYMDQKQEKTSKLYSDNINKHMENILGGAKTWNQKMSSALELPKLIEEGFAKGESEGVAAWAAKNAPAATGDKGGGAGKGAAAAESSLKSFIDTMTQETARSAGDSEAILNTWYGKQITSLDKIAAKNIDITDGKTALDAAYYFKLDKLNKDFNTWYANGLGGQYDKLVEEEGKKLAEVVGNAAKTAQVQEVFDKLHDDRNREMEATRIGLAKGYLDTMAGISPLLSEQLGYKKEALDLEIKLADLALEQEFSSKKITLETYESAKAWKDVVDQAKKFSLEREKWMTQGPMGGLKSGAIDRDKESATRTAQWTIDAMKGVESWIGDTGGQAFVDALHSRKTDLSKMFSDIGDSLIKQLFKMGTTKLFDTIWSALKPEKMGALGTDSNPMVVRLHGSGIGGLGGGGTPNFEKQMGKISYSSPSMEFGSGAGEDPTGKMLGGYKKLYKVMVPVSKLQDDMFGKSSIKEFKMFDKGLNKIEDKYGTLGDMQQEWIDGNQEAFNTQYMTEYADTLGGVTNAAVSIWGIGQAAMTMAGATGEAQRYGTMVSYGIQGLSLLYNIVAKGTIAKAWAAGGAAYSSTWEYLGFPAAVIVAPIMAALAFAGTMFAGTGGGGGGGSITSGTGGFSGYQGQGAHTGLLVAHNGLAIAHNGLAIAHDGMLADERLILAQTGEGILQRSAMSKWAGAGVGFDLLNDPNRLPVMPMSVGGGRALTTPKSQEASPRKITVEFHSPPIILDGREIYKSQKHHIQVDLDMNRLRKRAR